jgi:hypothetical protein
MAPAPLGLAYRIKEKNVGEAGRAVAAPYVVWDQEHVAVTANEALAAEASPGSDRSARRPGRRRKAPRLSGRGANPSLRSRGLHELIMRRSAVIHSDPEFTNRSNLERAFSNWRRERGATEDD